MKRSSQRQWDGLGQRVAAYGRMIKFSHTIFALPFALSAVVLALRQQTLSAGKLVWILLALTGARSAAMGFNRIVDARFDARNPRTAQREIPSGQLSLAAAKLFTLVAALVFIGSAGMLGRLCLALAGPVLLVLFLYSYTKRYTWLCHLYLGFAISLAPAGAWIALTNAFSWRILLLCLALLTYIAGFDILYACQDQGFDRREGLHSAPVQFGIKRAMALSSVLHALSFAFLLAVYKIFELNGIFLGAVVLIGLLLIIEHRMVKPADLKHLHVAFLHMNSAISVILFSGILADELVWRWI